VCLVVFRRPEKHFSLWQRSVQISYVLSVDARCHFSVHCWVCLILVLFLFASVALFVSDWLVAFYLCSGFFRTVYVQYREIFFIALLDLNLGSSSRLMFLLFRSYTQLTWRLGYNFHTHHWRFCRQGLLSLDLGEQPSNDSKSPEQFCLIRWAEKISSLFFDLSGDRTT
jgi:hypothetical protein